MDHIYTDKEMPIDEALEYMTEEWIEDGEACAQTLIDTVAVCRRLSEENKRLREQACCCEIGFGGSQGCPVHGASDKC